MRRREDVRKIPLLFCFWDCDGVQRDFNEYGMMMSDGAEMGGLQRKRMQPSCMARGTIAIHHHSLKQMVEEKRRIIHSISCHSSR